MIITESVEVKITNNAKFYKKYGDLKQGDVISVLVSDLPLNSNKVVTVKCDHCSDIFNRDIQNLNKRAEHLCYDCTRIHVGKKMDVSNIVTANRKRVGEKHPRFNPLRPAFERYKTEVYKLTEQNYKHNKEAINPKNYPRAICGTEGGYQLDHKTSIKRGFDKGISPDVVAHVTNLQMLPWKINRDKWF